MIFSAFQRANTLEESTHDMPASKKTSDVMDQTKSHIELVTNPELDDQSLLPEPNTEALNSHLHEESLKPITPSILLAPHMLKYHEKIIDRFSKDFYTSI